MAQHTAAVHHTKYVLDEADLPTQWYNINAMFEIQNRARALDDLHRAPMQHAEYREQIIKRQIRLMHERGIWVEPER